MIRGIVAAVVLGVSGLVGIASTSGGADPPKVHVTPIRITVGPGDLPDIVAAIAATRDVFYADVQRQIDEYLAWQHDQDVAAWVAAHTPPPRAPAGPTSAGYTNPGPSMGSCAGNVECFLACTIQHESASAGVYNAVSAGGTYRGAYQFDQTTWNGAVARAGHPEYVGTPPNLAPPEIQDAAATQLYGERGNQPWGGRC